MLNGLSNININHTGSTASDNTSDTSRDNDSHNNAPLEHSAEMNDADYTQHAPITDEEAEQMLPGYAIAFEGYHLYRAEGDAPEEALQKTLADWRKFWAANSYVPHRSQL